MALMYDIFSGFVTAIKGMAVTGKELFEPAITLQYPREKRELPERFRGMLVNDASICIACDKCVRICPVDCIQCEAEGKGKSRRPTLFTIDYVKCCWCELCVDSCPVDSLFMSKDYETVFTDRSMMIRDFVTDPIPPITTGDDDDEKSDKNKDDNSEEKKSSGRAAA
jgi:formate hydrogenlyase subunit 6/NADH:ubiquinone oxidoreductase subunit I